jgi:preprotein translocase subunit SecA
MYDLVMSDASRYYEKRETELTSPVMRDVERQVMLRIIDQRWREHLEEMDYLQEGINLRAMGQKDPLSEWQREGFDMFEAMMGSVDEDFVRYVFHLQVVVEEEPRPAVRNVRYEAAEDPVQGQASLRNAITAELAASSGLPGGADGDGHLGPDDAYGGGVMHTSVSDAPQVPVRAEKTPGRNEPCWCGSGKKYKMCHGR